MTGQPKYKGRPVELGGQVLIVPAMNAGTFEDFEDRIAALQAGTEPKPIGLVVDLLHRCLRRNYPEIEREFVREVVDVDNWAELFAVIMGESGYRQWVDAEAAAGNPRALQIQQTLSPGAGAPSSPTSPPASAGPSNTPANT
jgi:hypothetical protein